MSGRGFGPTKVVLEQRLLGFGIRGRPDAADGIVPIVKGVEGAVIEVAQEGMLKAVIRRVGPGRRCGCEWMGRSMMVNFADRHLDRDACCRP